MLSGLRCGVLGSGQQHRQHLAQPPVVVCGEHPPSHCDWGDPVTVPGRCQAARLVGMAVKARHAPGREVSSGTSDTWALTMRQPTGKRAHDCVWRPTALPPG